MPKPTNAATDLPTADATELRLLAEKADGLREQDLLLVEIVENGKRRLDLVAQSNVPSAAKPLASVRTNNVTKERRKFTIGLTLGDPVPEPAPRKQRAGAATQEEDSVLPNLGLPDALAEQCDALFWSEAAIDKFVVPYYVRLHGRQGLAALEDSFDTKPNIVAVAHTAPSETMSIGERRSAGFVALVESETRGGRIIAVPLL